MPWASSSAHRTASASSSGQTVSSVPPLPSSELQAIAAVDTAVGEGAAGIAVGWKAVAAAVVKIDYVAAAVGSWAGHLQEHLKQPYAGKRFFFWKYSPL